MPQMLLLMSLFVLVTSGCNEQRAVRAVEKTSLDDETPESAGLIKKGHTGANVSDEKPTLVVPSLKVAIEQRLLPDLVCVRIEPGEIGPFIIVDCRDGIEPKLPGHESMSTEEVHESIASEAVEYSSIIALGNKWSVGEERVLEIVKKQANELNKRVLVVVQYGITYEGPSAALVPETD